MKPLSILLVFLSSIQLQVALGQCNSGVCIEYNGAQTPEIDLCSGGSIVLDMHNFQSNILDPTIQVTLSNLMTLTLVEATDGLGNTIVGMGLPVPNGTIWNVEFPAAFTFYSNEDIQIELFIDANHCGNIEGAVSPISESIDVALLDNTSNQVSTYTQNYFYVTFPNLTFVPDTYSAVGPPGATPVAPPNTYLLWRRIELYNPSSSNFAFIASPINGLIYSSHFTADVQLLAIYDINGNLISSINTISPAAPDQDFNTLIDYGLYQLISGDSDGIWESNVTTPIVFWELLSVPFCNLAIQSSNQCGWKCPDGNDLNFLSTLCYETPVNLGEILAANFDPSVYVNWSRPIDLCYGDTNSSTYTLIFGNNIIAAANITNWLLEFFNDIDFEPSLTNYDNYQLVHTNGDPLDGDDIVDGANHSILVGTILPGEEYRLTFDVHHGCPEGFVCTQTQHIKDWKVNSSFGGFCDGHIQTFTGLVDPPVEIGGGLIPIGPGFTALTGNDDNDYLTPNQTAEFLISLNPGDVADHTWPGNGINQAIIIEFSIGPDMNIFDYNNDTYANPPLDTYVRLYNNSNLLPNTAYSIQYVAGSFDPTNTLPETIQIVLDLTNTDLQNSIPSPNLYGLLNNLILQVDLEPHCQAGLSNFCDLEVRHIPNTLCVEPCEIPLFCSSNNSIIINCPGCNNQGIHTDNFLFWRTNYGSLDASNNSMADNAAIIPTPVNHPSELPVGVAGDRVAYRDQFLTSFRGHVELDNGYHPWPAGSPPFDIESGQIGFKRWYLRLRFDSDGALSCWDDVNVNLTGTACSIWINGTGPYNIQFTSGIDFYNPLSHEYIFDLSCDRIRNLPGNGTYPIILTDNMVLRADCFFEVTENIGYDQADIECNITVDSYAALRAEDFNDPATWLVDLDNCGVDQIAFLENSCQENPPPNPTCESPVYGAAGLNIPSINTEINDCTDMRWECINGTNSATFELIGFDFSGFQLVNPGMDEIGRKSVCSWRFKSHPFYDYLPLRKMEMGTELIPFSLVFPFEFRNWVSLSELSYQVNPPFPAITNPDFALETYGQYENSQFTYEFFDTYDSNANNNIHFYNYLTDYLPPDPGYPALPAVPHGNPTTILDIDDLYTDGVAVPDLVNPILLPDDGHNNPGLVTLNFDCPPNPEVPGEVLNYNIIIKERDVFVNGIGDQAYASGSQVQIDPNTWEDVIFDATINTSNIQPNIQINPEVGVASSGNLCWQISVSNAGLSSVPFTWFSLTSNSTYNWGDITFDITTSGGEFHPGITVPQTVLSGQDNVYFLDPYHFAPYINPFPDWRFWYANGYYVDPYAQYSQDPSTYAWEGSYTRASMLRGEIYTINICIAYDCLNPPDPNEDGFDFTFGWSCTPLLNENPDPDPVWDHLAGQDLIEELPEALLHSCRDYSEPLSYGIFEPVLSMVYPEPPPIAASLCDEFIYDYTVANIGYDCLSEVLVQLDLPAMYTFNGQVQYSYNGSGFLPVTSVTDNGDGTFTINLSPELPNNCLPGIYETDDDDHFILIQFEVGTCCEVDYEDSQIEIYSQGLLCLPTGIIYSPDINAPYQFNPLFEGPTAILNEINVDPLSQVTALGCGNFSLQVNLFDALNNQGGPNNGSNTIQINLPAGFQITSISGIGYDWQMGSAFIDILSSLALEDLSTNPLTVNFTLDASVACGNYSISIQPYTDGMFDCNSPICGVVCDLFEPQQSATIINFDVSPPSPSYTFTGNGCDGYVFNASNGCGNYIWEVDGIIDGSGSVYNFNQNGVYTICLIDQITPNSSCISSEICTLTEACDLNENGSCYYIPSAALYDYGSETILGPDGKLATIGELESPLNPGDIDIYLVGHNQSMGVEFNAMFGDMPEDEYTEHNTSICTDGEFYYTLGFIEDNDGTAIFVTKTQLDGTPVWNGGNPVGIAYGFKDSHLDIGFKIIYMTGRQNLLIVGRTDRLNTSGYDVFALQLDKTTGAVVPGGYQIYYANTPEVLSDEYAYDVKEVVSDKLYYAIAGETRLTNGERNGLGLLIDDNLTLLADFATTGMNDQEEVFYGVEQFDDYLYFSGMYSRIGFDKEGLIMQVPFDITNFNVVEAHYYDGALLSATARDDIFGAIVRDGDHMVISGRTNDTDPLGTKDAAAIFVSNNLNAPYPTDPVRTNKEFMPDAFFDVCVLPDQLVFTGTISPTGSNDEIFIVNTDKNGINDCCTKPYDFKNHLLDKESHRTLDQKSENIAKEPWGLYDNYSNTVDLCDTVDTCYHPCLVVANWNFQHVKGCTYQLGDASSFLPGTIITSYEWSIDGGPPFDFGVSPSVTLSPGPHTICLLVRGINELGEKCEDKFCQVLTCCEQQQEECGGIAMFAATPLINPCVYQFTDLSTAFSGSVITGWTWDFGDGSNSTVQNPIHAYGDDGPYSVLLTVEYLQGENKCVATFELIINPHCSPNCDISISDLGLHPDACNLITNPIISYSGPCTIHYYWEFGDGTVSNLPNPVHTYEESGVYEICLTVWVECNGYMCSARSCKSGVAINCPCQCSGVPQFTLQQTADCEVTLTYLNNLNPCLNIQDIKWDFGNGQSMSGSSVVYQYPAAGSYQICLIITASNGLSVCNLIQCQPITVSCSNGFAANTGEGTSSLMACCEPTDFTIDNDGCSICVNPIGGHCSPYNDYFFSWGDGTPNGDGPCHTYTSSGTYTITLWDNCSYTTPHQIMQHNVVVDCPCDHECFIRARWTFEELEPCTFALTDLSVTDLYSTIDSWEWYLNGIPFSTSQNTTVTITGTQAVCLHIIGHNEEHEICDSWYCQNLTCCEQTEPCLIHSVDFAWVQGTTCMNGYFDVTIAPVIDETLLCGQWTIDGIPVATFTSFQLPYTFLSTGGHRVCLDIWCCDDPQTVFHICHDISISCPCDLENMSFTWTSNEEDCSSGVFNVTVDPLTDADNFCGNWTINGITIPFSGFALPYNFLPGGPWVICLDLQCCEDPTSQTLITYCDTIVTCPCCAPVGFEYEVCTGSCDISVTPTWPAACVNPGTLVYDYGDGSGLTGDECHDYVDNGSYVVCMYMICQVMIPQLIACDTVDISCDDSFCKTLHNPADPNRPRNDRGSSIASTPDGGFILVGTVNEQYGFCAPSSVYNTLACASDESDIYIAKYSSSMTLEFDMTLGETDPNPSTFYHEVGSGVLVRDDGYYILGDVLINDYGQANILDNDIVVAKINLDGSLGWHKRLGTKTADNAKSREYSAAIVDMEIAGEDAILITGTSNRFATVGSPSNNGSNYDFLAVKMDPSNGNVILRKGYWYGNSNISSNNLVERARDAVRIETTTNPIYGIAGEIFYSSNNERRVFAITIDQNLNLLNNFVLNGPGTFERAWTIESANGNIYIGGGMGTTANTDMFILKLNQNLTLTDQKRLSIASDSHEFLREIKAMSDGKLVGIFQNGSVATPGGFECNGYLFTIDPVNLNVSDIMSTASPGYDERFVALSDNYYVTGYWDYNAYSTNIYDQNRELYLSKFNATDNSSCCVEPITLTSSTLTGTTSGAGQRELNFLTLDHGVIALSYEFNEICPMELRSAQSDEQMSHAQIQQGIMLMPNPNQGLFTLSSIDSESIMEANIIDVSGKTVYSYKCTECSETLTLSLNDLSQGIYFVQTITSNGKWINKLVIQN